VLIGVQQRRYHEFVNWSCGHLRLISVMLIANGVSIPKGDRRSQNLPILHSFCKVLRDAWSE